MFLHKTINNHGTVFFTHTSIFVIGVINTHMFEVNYKSFKLLYLNSFRNTQLYY